jgi:hypothetical protein
MMAFEAQAFCEYERLGLLELISAEHQQNIGRFLRCTGFPDLIEPFVEPLGAQPVTSVEKRSGRSLRRL